MITKHDLMLLLGEMSDAGVDTTQKLKLLITSKDVPMEVVKYVNDNRQLDVSKFYENLRKNYNNKKSKLYGNIVKDITDVTEVLTTLASLNLQILLYSKKVEDRQMFLRHCRAEEICKVLTLYYKNYDLSNCVKLLHLIKADLVAFECLSGRRIPQ